jgi:tripartite-type tricarboxylate transporter receptor subunit TctC
MGKLRAIAAACALIGLAGLTPGSAQAQQAAAIPAGYPSKPIKIIVPFPPGGPTDVMGRLVAQRLSESIGQAVIIDNRAGAGGTVGAEAGARAPADGYTLFYGSTSTLAIAPSLHGSLPYHPVKSFAPISLIARGPMAMVVNIKLPVRTLGEFVALAKSKPGMLHYGSAGNGTPPHLAAELFKSLAGVDVVHVPYKGASPAMGDLMAGSIDLLFESTSTVQAVVRGGKVRALAVTGVKRDAGMPEVPTSAEAGLPKLEVWSWNGLVAPFGTPEPVINRIGEAMRKAAQSPELKGAVERQGMELHVGTPAEFASFIATELARWGEVVKLSGARVD